MTMTLYGGCFEDGRFYMSITPLLKRAKDGVTGPFALHLKDNNESKDETNLCWYCQVKCLLINTKIDSFHP